MREEDARHVVLIGTMGVGKTTIGRRLADRLGLQFTDSDEQLLEMVGMNAQRYAAEHGVSALHEAEVEALMQALSRPPSVIAAAASVADSPSAFATLAISRARVVVLEAPPEVTWERITGSRHRRDVTRAEMARLAARREGNLRDVRAVDVVDTSLSGVEQIVDRLTRILSDRPI